MRQSMTIRLDPVVLKAARGRARRQNRTLTNYIETVLRRDLQLDEDEPSLEVVAPPGLRDYEPVPIAGESPKRREFRRRLVSALLDQSGQ